MSTGNQLDRLRRQHLEREAGNDGDYEMAPAANPGNPFAHLARTVTEASRAQGGTATPTFDPQVMQQIYQSFQFQQQHFITPPAEGTQTFQELGAAIGNLTQGVQMFGVTEQSSHDEARRLAADVAANTGENLKEIHNTMSKSYTTLTNSLKATQETVQHLAQQVAQFGNSVSRMVPQPGAAPPAAAPAGADPAMLLILNKLVDLHSATNAVTAKVACTKENFQSRPSRMHCNC